MTTLVVSRNDFKVEVLLFRLRLHCRRNKLVRELEEMVRLASTLHTQLKSLSASTLSCSSGSSRGSLTSSRGSLATTSSLGSTSSLSFTDIYLEQPELSDPDFQNKLDSLLQEGGAGGFRPTNSITTIHEHEVVTGSSGGREEERSQETTGERGGETLSSVGGMTGPDLGPARIQNLRLSETPGSMSSLSPCSSLSSLSPPCSPLVTDANFLSGERGLAGSGRDQLDLDLELRSRLTELELSLDPEKEEEEEEEEEEVHGRGGGLQQKKIHESPLRGEVKGSAPLLQEAGTKKMGVSSAVSDESVAGDSGVYEPSERRTGLLPVDLLTPLDDGVSPSFSPQVQLGLRYKSREQRFSVHVLQLSNCSALCLQQKMYLRVAVLPCLEATPCLFRTRGYAPQEVIEVNEVFGTQISHSALRQKTLRLDVCSAGPSGHEECLAGAQISLADVTCSEERSTKWYNLLSHAHLCNISSSSEVKEHSGGAGSAGTAVVCGSDTVRSVDNRSWPGSDPLDLLDDEEGHGIDRGRPLEEDKSQWGAEEGGQCHQVTDRPGKEVEEEEPSPVTSLLAPVTVTTKKVNKETSVDGLSSSSHHCSVVRPKERRPDVQQLQNPFMRGNTIIRSKTFSPGPQSQYICRINRSDSDSSTLSKKSPFVRNASERRSMRMKKPPVQTKGLDGLLRTSLDLELDLQVSRTRQARLTQELQVLRELKTQLEEAHQQGRTELPTWVQEDERFRLLLKQAEKQTREEQQQEKRVEKMMRAAAKDVHKIRGQGCKEVPEVQTFREKMAFFTRAKSNIPDLPADSV
ncbi:protein KIBRA [Cynoglossus semilaevis]|uniref:protein KIBRA n=1 Tax=Cynoglossus semilaevis TaxID=244447 RepID=UPI000494E709|nr:protein KIBRA [Cynoglossus semilaevis]